MYGIMNKILGIIVAFVLVIFMLANVMVADQLQARRSIVAEVTNFIDEITDSAAMDDQHIADLYLACNAYGPICDVQVLRYTRVVNPVPGSSPPRSRVSYVPVDKTDTWNQGDICQVTVKEVGMTGLSYFLYNSLGLHMAPVDFTLAGRVRK